MAHDKAEQAAQTAADPASAERFERLLEQVYGELRRIAHFHRLNERQDLTLQTTALVHEAYLRLARGQAVPEPEDARHLKALTSRVIRHVLVDYARQHRAQKRDAGPVMTQPLGAPDPAQDVDVLDLDAALRQLADMSPRLAQVVEYRYFGGLSVEETAHTLSLSTRTVERDWIRARAYLLDCLDKPPDD